MQKCPEKGLPRILVCPSIDARLRAVMPAVSCKSVSAPACASKHTTSTCPFREALVAQDLGTQL